MTLRQPYQDAVLAIEDIAMIRQALAACSQLLSGPSERRPAVQRGGQARPRRPGSAAAPAPWPAASAWPSTA